jgi:ribosomal protein L37AE/L43A
VAGLRGLEVLCPRCGNEIGVTDYPRGIWGLAFCGKCGAKFNVPQMLRAGYEIVYVSEEEAKKILCIQTDESIEADEWK